MSAEAPWLDAPVVDDPEPWKSAPIVEDAEQPWLSAPVVEDAPSAPAERFGSSTAPWPTADSSPVAPSLPAEDIAITQRAAAEGKPVVMVDGKPTIGEAPQNAPLSSGDQIVQGIERGLGGAALRVTEGVTRLVGASGAADALGNDVAAMDAILPKQTTGGKVGTGVGGALALLSGGGLPGALGIAGTQAVAGGYDSAYEESLKKGNPEEIARIDAQQGAFKSVLRTVPELAAYWLLGLGAAKIAEPLVRGAGPLVKAAVTGAAATGANVATSTVLHGLHGEPLFTAEGLAMDATFGFGAHGLAVAKQAVSSEAQVREMLKSTPLESLKAAAEDPAFRKSSPYRPELIDAELASRTSNAGATPEGSPPIPEPTPSAAAPAPTLAEPSVAQRVSAEGEALATTPATGSTRPIGRGAEPLRSVGEAPIASGERVIELLPEQAEVAAPKLDVKRSPFALGISPDAKVMTWLSSNVKRLFTATGDLPKQTFEGWIERNGFVKEQSRQTAYATRDLYSALKDEFKISTTETLTKGFAKVPPEFVKQMNQALLGEVDINTLPERVRAPLQAMRDHVDAMSQKMLSEGVVPAELQAKVADNLGTYLTRSYRIFDDPVWAEKIPQDVRNRARDFIYSNLKKTDPAATPETARAVMESMLQDWKDQGTGALVKTGGKLGSKDLTSFIARKDIPQVLREVMGEYHDPTINYARSVTKMANLIGSQRFLGQVRAEGMGKFLFEDGKQPATHTARIAAEGSDVMAPLNGLRTTPEIATAFREFGKMDPIKDGFVRAYYTISGAAKMAKTVGSAMTQARNAFGQAYFFAMNGHFDMTKAAPAVKAVLADLGAKDTPAGREAYQRYLRLGIVDQSARASELRDIIKDTGLNDPGMNLTEPGMVLARTAKKLTVDAAAKAYQISDDLGKIIGFENELVRQREIHPEWSETTLEAATAERIRNTYPTYSMTSKAVQNLRKLPFAPFASFAAETFRTAYHNLRYTIEDLQSANPAQKKAGAQRLAGQVAVLGSGYALSAISQAMLGMNAQDEDDARRFMAPWDKDSQIMFTGKGPGEAKYINASYVNPYSYLTDPVIAVASGLRDQDQLDEVMIRSLSKLLQPFTGEDIAAGAAMDVLRNKTSTGARVFNPGDTPARRWEDKVGHLLKTLEPGTVSRMKSKIIPAIKGETDRYGRKPELTNELLNELTGFKQQTLDYKQAIGFKAYAFKKADDDADSIFREVAARRGSVATGDVVDAYKRATRSKFEVWQDMYRDVQAARRRGVSDSEIRTAIESRRVSSADAGSVMDGKFTPPQISDSLKKQIKASGRDVPSGVNAEENRAKGLVLSGKFQPAP